ncbi:uncharacterized protein LOC128242214 [Mya arenaria]|uniref:uncharacterized protein LOC128242214 n=1 Tax=Mya arenaria TaxID=6604 RepID=UPI0022E91EC9|nr:uncharacterized protein LOC128242214 [Mya arenaria]
MKKMKFLPIAMFAFKREIKVIAEGYCVDCEEYLCAVCFSCHCRPKPSRGHVLQSKDEMPKPGSPKRTQHKSASPCLIHPEKDVTHFCKTHDQLCCVLCISIGHSICPDIKVIADEAKDFEQSEQLKELKADLSRIESTVTSRKQLAKNNDKRLSIMKQMAVEAFNEELEKLSIPDNQKLDGIIEKCDTIGTKLSLWKSRLQTLLADKNSQQTYLFLNHTRKQLSCVDSEIQQAGCDCSINHFRFEKVTEEIVDGKVIGKLLSYTPGKARFIAKIKISHADDKQKSLFRDLAVLDNDCIVCADENNSCLKVVDVRQKSI